jgi:hypothetical protein
MIRAQLIERNDTLRTTFAGGLILMTPSVWELPAQLRGRALYRMTVFQKIFEESDHSEGVFIFAGYSFVWRIEEFAGELSLTLMLAEDL